VNNALERQQKDFERTMMARSKRLSDSIAEALWDDQAFAKRKLIAAELKDAEARLITRRGWSGAATKEYEKRLKNIDRLVTHTNEKSFSEYLEMRRLVEVSDLKGAKGEDYDLPYGITPEQAKKWVAEFESQKQAEGTLDTYKSAANEYYAASKTQLDQLLKEGLLSKEGHASLVENHKNYSPQQMIQYLDPDDTSGLVGKGAGAPIKALKGGSESGRVVDYRYLMARTIASAQSRIFNNRANKELVNGVGNEKAAKEIGAIIDDGTYDRIPFGYERITAYEKGQAKSIFVPKDFAKSWTGADPILRSDAAKFLGSISTIIKAQATGLNPEFIVSNTPRDILFSYLNTKEYSPIVPIGAVQQAKDLSGAFKDALHQRGKYLDYVNDGGSLDGLSKEGRLDKNPWEKVTPTSETVRTVSNFLGGAGEFSERWVRLAVYNRAIKNGKSSLEAAKIARDMLDFAQGGTFIKAADKFLPYLNAGTQGTRALFSNIDAEKLFKMGQIAAIGAAFEAINSKYNEEAWEAISDQEKATKWIIPLYKYTDDDGRQRFKYIGISKDQGAALLSSIGAASARITAGKKANATEILNSIKNAFPDSGLLAGPVAESLIAYFANFDLFRMDEVYKGRPTTPSTEFSDVDALDNAVQRLSELSGGAVEVSPARLKAAASKIILPHNPVTAGLMIVPKYLLGEENFTEMVKELISLKPGIRRVIRDTPPTEVPSSVAEKAERLGVDIEGRPARAARQEVYKAEQQLGAQRNIQDREIRRIMTKIKKGEATKQELIDFINQTPDDYTRLRNRIKTIQEEFGLQLYIPPKTPASVSFGGKDFGGKLSKPSKSF